MAGFCQFWSNVDTVRFWPRNRVLARRRALWRACVGGESKRPGLLMKPMRRSLGRKADSVPERGLLAISGPILRTTCWVARSVMPYGASNRMAGRTARHDAPRDATSRAASRAPCGFVASRPASLRDAARPALRGSVALRTHTPLPRCVLRAQWTCRVASRLVPRRSPHPADLSRTSRSADLSRRVPRPATERCAMPARVAPAQSTARSSRRPSRSGCPRNR